MAKKNTPKGALSPPSSSPSTVRGRGRGRGRRGIQQTNSPPSTKENNNTAKLPEPHVNNTDDVIYDVIRTGIQVASTQISDPIRNPGVQASDQRNEDVTEINKSDGTQNQGVSRVEEENRVETGIQVASSQISDPIRNPGVQASDQRNEDVTEINKSDGTQNKGVSRVEEENRVETGIQVASSQISDPNRNPGARDNEEVTEINKSDRTGNNVDGAQVPVVSRVEEENPGDAGSQATDALNSNNIVGETEEDRAGAKTDDQHVNVKGTGNYDDGAKNPEYPRAVLQRKKNIRTDNSGMQLVRVDGLFDEIEGHKVWKTESMSHWYNRKICMMFLNFGCFLYLF